MKKILIHGSGHRADSWSKVIEYMNNDKDILCPTLVISGEKDSANIKSAYYLSEHIKNAELKIIANTGHVVNEENPKELASVISEYWK